MLTLVSGLAYNLPLSCLTTCPLGTTAQLWGYTSASLLGALILLQTESLACKLDVRSFVSAGTAVKK